MPRSSPYADLDRPPLRGHALERALVGPAGPWSEVRLLGQCESTNAEVRAAAAAGAGEGLVVIAEEQTAGRGRLGRSWTAPARAALTFSVLLRPDGVPVRRWGWLPLLAGVAAAAALSARAEVPARVKWPNDVLVPAVDEHLGVEDGRIAALPRGGGQRKVAGVLVERVEDAGPRGAAAVLGIGINVSQRPDELPVPTATSLALAGARCTDRDPLLRSVLRELANRYGEWLAVGGDPARSALPGAYAALSATLGRRVRVTLPGGGLVEGQAERIDGDGRLVLSRDQDGEAVALSAGDVVHLRT